jgi:hypothetical protein
VYDSERNVPPQLSTIEELSLELFQYRPLGKRDNTSAMKPEQDGGLKMDKEPLIELPWRGEETIANTPRLLDQARQVKITLPANYNHSLFSVFHPGAPPGQPEAVDISGGRELLATVASIKGLEGIARLADELPAEGVAIRVMSPPAIVITLGPRSPRSRAASE